MTSMVPLKSSIYALPPLKTRLNLVSEVVPTKSRHGPSAAYRCARSWGESEVATDMEYKV